MGLLDYIRANTPCATRPVARPGQVINQGLLSPNTYNVESANRFKDSAFGLPGIVPGLGDAASVAESADLWNRGEQGMAALAGRGALPLVPAPADCSPLAPWAVFVIVRRNRKVKDGSAAGQILRIGVARGQVRFVPARPLGLLLGCEGRHMLDELPVVADVDSVNVKHGCACAHGTGQ